MIFLLQGNRNNTLLQIPEYQRNYKWGSEQVERLIKNFLTSFHKIETNENKTSFLGSIIFCPGKCL